MSRYRCMCPRHRPSTLAEIAPRLFKAQQQLRESELQRLARKRMRIAEARDRKRQARYETATRFCGKVRYLSQAEAEEGPRETPTGVRLYVYECAVCGGWHLSKHRHVRWAKHGETDAA